MNDQHESIESKKVIAAISPENRHKLSGLEVLEQIDSTNSYLMRHAKEIKQSGWACLAEQQTKGRGRQEREWFSPYKTNIYCSLLWHFPYTFAGISALSIAYAAMIVRALRALGVKNNIALKWPNDVLLYKRKLAGILLENIRAPNKNLVVAGVGLNLHLPEERQKEWASLEEVLVKPISRNLVAGILLDNLLSGITQFQTRGLKEFLPLYREHDVLLKKKISINGYNRCLIGTAQGINDQGELIVLDEKGVNYNFCYGEVSIRNY